MEVNQLTKISLAWELFECGVPKAHIAMQLAVQRETVHLWVKGIQEYGHLEFLERYTKAKRVPRPGRQVDPILKRWVWEIREREIDCCGQKIQYFLKKEHKIHLSVPKIYQILSEKYVIRSKWKKNKARGPVVHPTHPRKAIQMDTIDFGGMFAFTGVDCFTREADILLAPELTSEYGYTFLAQSRSEERR